MKTLEWLGKVFVDSGMFFFPRLCWSFSVSRWGDWRQKSQRHRFGGHLAWFWIPYLTLTNCVAFSKSVNSRHRCFLICKMRRNTTGSPSQDLMWIQWVYTEHLPQCKLHFKCYTCVWCYYHYYNSQEMVTVPFYFLPSAPGGIEEKNKISYLYL